MSKGKCMPEPPVRKEYGIPILLSKLKVATLKLARFQRHIRPWATGKAVSLPKLETRGEARSPLGLAHQNSSLRNRQGRTQGGFQTGQMPTGKRHRPATPCY